MSSAFTGRSVVVTGAGGSIGSQLCCKAAEEGASRLTLISLTEGGLYTIDKNLRKKYPGVDLVPVVGSAGNRSLMSKVLQGTDVVVHAAAHKHVPLCELNAVEAICNNTIGTLDLALAARDAGVAQFCLISYDKAVRPASIMGATKRLSELLIGMFQPAGTRFFTVRFGNVMDSAGSVLPLWREQIRLGEPITITDERCERYFMSIASAVGLIASVIEMGPRRGTFVLDMGKPRKLVDMAHELMTSMDKWSPIKIIGLRPGEKLTEELFHGGELVPTAVPGVLEVEDRPPEVDWAKMAGLFKAVDRCDRDRAVSLLWELVC